MATIAPEDVNEAGLAAATFTAAASGGDQFKNDGKTLILIEDASGASRTTTVADQGSVQPVGATTFDADVEVDTSDGDVAVVGPFPTGRFNDANGFVQLTYDNEAGLTIAVVRLP